MSLWGIVESYDSPLSFYSGAFLARKQKVTMRY